MENRVDILTMVAEKEALIKCMKNIKQFSAIELLI